MTSEGATSTPMTRAGELSLRNAFDFALVLVLAATVFKLFVAEGYFVPTGSMAPGLLGIHQRATCLQCGYIFPVGKDSGDWVPPSVSCPTCRHARSPLGSSPLENGDRLLVLKGAYDIVPPKRWETVVFYNPNDPGQAYVKRAIGLPGERVRIEHGDVFVNEKIMRKSFDQLVAMALPVYDDHAGPTRSIADRWISSPEDRWSLTGRCHRVDAGDAPIEHAYQHLDLDARDAPIKDDNPYNAAHEAEGTEIVRDLIVRCRLAHQSGPGVVGVTLRLDAYTSFELRLCPESGLAELMSTGKRIAHRLLNPWPGQSRTIQLAHWDQRVGVRLDGKPPWSDIDLDAAPLDSDAVMAPLVLTAQNLRLSADLIRIDRDVHYRSAPRTMIRRAGDDSFPLGQDEYFMLGDNSAVSNDSRSWSITAVPRRLLLGRPVFVHLPTTAWRGEVMGRTVEWSLPDLRRMRIVR